MVTKRALMGEVFRLDRELREQREANALLAKAVSSAEGELSALKAEVEGLRMVFEDPSKRKADPVASYVRAATDFSAGHSFHPNEDYHR